MMRKSLGVAAVLALLVAIYAAAGYWIAPGYVREALAELAVRRGLSLEMTTVRTNPFALRVELGGIALRGPQGRVFVEAERALADIAWASLWRRGWIFDEVRVGSPQVAVGKLPEMYGAPALEGEPAAYTVRELVVENGTLRYAPRELALEGLALHARDLSTLDAAASTYEASARLAGDGGRLASRGTLALAALAAEGTLDVGALRAAQLLPDAQGELQGSARFVFADSRFELRDVSISGDGLAYAGVELPQATLRAANVPVPPRDPVEVAAQASVAPQGKLAAHGRVRISPLELHLNVNADGWPLAQAQRWLPPHVALRIVSGTVSGTGLLDVAAGEPAYRGSATVRNLRLEERNSGALLLALQHAETESLRIASSPFEIEAGEIMVRAPEGRLVIAQEGTVNFAQAFANGDEDEALRAAFERLRIENGTLDFTDRSLANPFEVTIRSLAGSITGFTTAQGGEPARVRLNGRVQPYGTARIRGTIDLDAPANLADLTANFRNLRLQAFNPYVAKFAGRRIESGSLSAELRYQVRDGRLTGSNELVFENMQLGEKLEEKGLLDVPLELAVALLAGSKGRIDLDIPVRGNLKDPQFDLGAIIARAFGNVLKKIVSAPFRALAGLFGGGDEDDPGSVAFAPGSASLPPPAEERVAKLAAALAERPRLGVEVRGGYDPALDLHALRLRSARRELARAAGLKGPPDLSSPEVLRAAERLYLERGGERGALEAMRKSEERYGRALLERLAAGVPVDEDAAQALARERAEAVRAALADHGADPARIRIAAPEAAPAGEEGIATALSLTSVDDAAAGGTAPAPPHAAPDMPANLREVQRRLNAAGFDAGPVDGILGPRTRGALLRFQAANELEPSGEVDAATLERLAS